MSSHYRRSGDDLAYGEDYSSPQRWDRARFDRARRGGSRDIDIDVRESDRYRGPRGSGYREVDIDERSSRGGPPRSRYEDDRRSEFVIRERESDGREMAPYKSRYDRELPPRGYARRPPSPGGYDDRRYHDDERDVNISVHVDNNDRHYPPPPREQPNYEDDRYRGRYEDDYRVRREVEREIWRPSRDSYEEREEFYEHDSEHLHRERKGKTKMPKRLVHKRAIVEFGFPFVEEDDFYWVQTPLDQGQIDEVLRISDRFFKEEVEFSKKTETKYLEAPPAPKVAEPGPIETTTTTTTTIIENPTDEEIADLSRAQNNDDNDDDDNGDENVNVNVNVENASVATAHGTTKANEETTNFHENIHEHSSNRGGSDDKDERISAHGSSTSHGRHLSVNESSRGHRSRSRHEGHHRGRSKSHHRRSKSGVRRFYDDDVVEESATIGLGPLGSLQIRDRSRRRSTAARERDIKAEIKDLEAEKRALREKQHHHHHHHSRDNKDSGDFEEVVRIDRHRSRSSSSGSGSRGGNRDDGVVRVEKDRSGRLNLVRSAR